MGNPRKQNAGKPKYEPSIQHFSHGHPLELLNIKDQPTINLVLCAGCKLKPSEWVYACKPCNFLLHIPCSQMPKLIRHPADPNHTFTLLTTPAYPTGLFGCDACGEDGDAFNYSCSTCGIDIHILCATKPLSLTHQTHRCPLNLTFSHPSPSKSFSCNICQREGFNHWVYRCNPCDFDAHLSCATQKPSSSPSRPPVFSQYQTRSLVQPQAQRPLYQQPLPQPQSPLHYQQYVQPTGVSAAEQAKLNFIQNYMAAQQADQARIMSMVQSNNGGINAAQMQSLIANSAAGAVTQQYLQSMLGGNNNVANNSGIDSITQLMQGLLGGGQQAAPNPLASFMGGFNNAAGGGMGQQFAQGIFGGGQQADPNVLAGFMGGLNGDGTGGTGQQYNQDFMQNILGGGNGGGQDFLQNILGGDGGASGLDGVLNMFGGL
ncbi:hypothetical protein ACHQM5_005377 [Ranunculus cassubicifolius]